MPWDKPRPGNKRAYLGSERRFPGTGSYWGEVVVENLLQSMGFVEGRDYIKQEWDKGKNGEKGKRTWISY